jgi:hypothetical protein
VVVASGRAGVVRLNTEAGKLRDQVSGKASLAPAVLLELQAGFLTLSVFYRQAHRGVPPRR